MLKPLGTQVRRPLSAANLTAAGLFRRMEACEPTLLVDQADTFLDGREDPRGVPGRGTVSRNGRRKRESGSCGREDSNFHTLAGTRARTRIAPESPTRKAPWRGPTATRVTERGETHGGLFVTSGVDFGPGRTTFRLGPSRRDCFRRSSTVPTGQKGRSSW